MTTPLPKPKRRRSNTEKVTGTDEYKKFVIRLLRKFAPAAKVSRVDISALEQLREIQEELDKQTAEVVLELRAQGYSWQAIGDALGIGRAGAYKKFVGRPGIADAEGARKPGGQPAEIS